MGQIVKSFLDEELKERYPRYALDVATNRALPDVRDGLKPVHRRILYGMNGLNLVPDKGYRKCARIVGEVLGKYHPHGDTSVYDALVRMAQDFSMRYMLVDGHGNFGSVDGDSAAAMRYTEAKMRKLMLEMLRDINKDTVDFTPNFDGEEKEPVVLPSRFPNLLVNGSSGIAVGMTTNIPPHNLGETIEAITFMIDNPNCNIDDLIDIIKSPDLPTGAEIINNESIKQMYKTGEGSFIIKSKYHIETDSKYKYIVFTEIPYQINKSNLVIKIVDLINDNKNIFKNVNEVRDESDRNGMRIVIEIKKYEDENKILSYLFKKTSLKYKFNGIFRVLVDGIPRVLNLKELINYYIEFQKEIITRRSKFELNKDNNRIHILEGLKIALDNIDEVIRIIRNSQTSEIAKNELINNLKLSEKQTNVILEMKLRRLTGLEISNIEKEYNELLKEIEYLNKVLSDGLELNNLLKNELNEIKDKYGDERRTTLLDDYSIEQLSKLSKEDFIEDYNCRIAYTSTYIKKHQKKSDSHNIKEGEVILGDIEATNKSTLLIFTDKANRYKIPVYELETYTPSKLGDYIYNILPIDKSEQIIKIVSIKEPKGNIYFIYENGNVAKIDVSSFISNNKKLQNCYSTESKLLDIYYSEKEIDIFMLSSEGKAIIYNTDKLNTKKSRNSQGVRGIKILEGFKCIGTIMNVTKENNIKLTISNGKTKEIMLDDVLNNNDKRTFDYLHMRVGNGGNFLYNTRRDNSRIVYLEQI